MSATNRRVQSRPVLADEANLLTTVIRADGRHDHVTVRAERGCLYVDVDENPVVRLEPLSGNTYGLSFHHHSGRWEPTPFTGDLSYLASVLTAEFGAYLNSYDSSPRRVDRTTSLAGLTNAGWAPAGLRGNGRGQRPAVSRVLTTGSSSANVIQPSCLHGHSALRARVLAVYGQGCSWAASDPDTVLAVCSSDRMAPGYRVQDARARRPSARKARSAIGGHAAVSSDGHVSQAADRLASARARRAATAPDVRCAGTASPVPKYISSGVCPRNAEWGSTRLCSST